MRSRQRYFFGRAVSPFQRGYVTEININGTAKVRFPQQGNVISGWLPVIATYTQDNKDWWLPDVGELVTCIVDENFEDGVVLGSSYSTTDTPPSAASRNTRILQFSDGAALQYDRSSHVLTVTLPSGATANVTAPDGITLNGVTIDQNGNLNSPGTVNGATDVMTNGVSLKNHPHSSGSLVAGETVVTGDSGAPIAS